ncbi:hypothetical protein PHLGIDRAFT_336510 [Phlebiopsis gigantea 11061_1 CR5-6]|uniref:Uncharacterized protein n=1 Tax=Phlebiopsis gigantea (strain 11061_1 CR5-6) TaxID=745531 RepID=A0A0C3NB67_PHLG1|nr:hypothetical protein PHLGIDRAFT_336510 [Phlebiopsis gigantea 11061_1 CR5-6]
MSRPADESYLASRAAGRVRQSAQLFVAPPDCGRARLSYIRVSETTTRMRCRAQRLTTPRDSTTTSCTPSWNSSSSTNSYLSCAPAVLSTSSARPCCSRPSLHPDQRRFVLYRRHFLLSDPSRFIHISQQLAVRLHGPSAHAQLIRRLRTLHLRALDILFNPGI